MCKYQIQMVENVLSMVVNQDQDYRTRSRVPLEDLFVSCGRPVIMNLRPEVEALPMDLRHFQVV